MPPVSPLAGYTYSTINNSINLVSTGAPQSHDLCILLSTIEAEDHNELLIYPNPIFSSLDLHFLNSNEERATLTLTNELGEKVYRREIFVEDQALDFSMLPKGFYVINVQTDTDLLIEKFVKQ
jgi:hypothetical protein